MKPIAVIDYGMGNLRSVQKGIERSGRPAIVTDDLCAIAEAPGVVLPGVGAFARCMENLASRGLVPAILRAIDEGKPFLGICLGLQVLFETSEEFGDSKGLGVFRGRVVRFPAGMAGEDGGRLDVPHMGWNRVHVRGSTPFLDGIEDGSFVYFVHSYYVAPEDPAIVATTTLYGGEFVSSIRRGKLFACQFHPEKSQKIGLRILASFASLCGTADR